MSDPRDRSIGSLEKAIRAGVDSALVELHTALPGVVEAFDASAQEADVRIPLRRIVRDVAGQQSSVSVPLLARVPVWTPRVSGFSIALPLQAGDEVLVIFLERDASAWLEAGGDQDPQSARRHHLSDAVALPGLTSAGNRVPSYQSGALEVRNDARTSRLTLHADGTVEVVSTSTVSIGDGTEEIVTLLSDLAAAVKALEVFHDAPRPVWTPHQATIQAIKDRIDSLKA